MLCSDNETGDGYYYLLVYKHFSTVHVRNVFIDSIYYTHPTLHKFVLVMNTRDNILIYLIYVNLFHIL